MLAVVSPRQPPLSEYSIETTVKAFFMDKASVNKAAKALLEANYTYLKISRVMTVLREDLSRRNSYEITSEIDAILLWVEYRLFRIHIKCQHSEVRPFQGNTLQALASPAHQTVLRQRFVESLGESCSPRCIDHGALSA